jgi:hypothetical protein
MADGFLRKLRNFFDMWTSKGGWRRLVRDLQNDDSWLFEKYGARVIPMKPHRQVMDYSSVTLAISDLLVQISRGMGEFRVSIAPAHEPDDWYDLGTAIDLARDSGELSTHYRSSNFRQLFESNMGCLENFFSEKEYGAARRDISKTKLDIWARSPVFSPLTVR